MDEYVALALGYGSLYNHSKDPNCKYKLNIKNRTITVTAIKDIGRDEEILFNYKQSLPSKDGKASTTSKAPLWFEKGVK